MNNLPCEVVRDLLPSYVDGLTSETTNKLVDGHIETCEPCRAALEAMRAPEETLSEGKTREIDYLKKNKKRNRAVVAWSIMGALLLAVAVILAWPFVHETELTGVVLSDICVEGGSYSMKLICTDSMTVVTSVTTWESDGVLYVKPKGTLPSFLHRGIDSVNKISGDFGEPIRQVRMAERICWDDGAEIGKAVSDLYLTYHDYVGDMSANQRTAQAIGVYELFGAYENELTTSERPYRWTIALQNDIPESRRRYAESNMRAASCMMLAMVGNLDEACFAYTVDGVPARQTVTAEEASELLGQNVKDCAGSVRLLQELRTTAITS